MEIWITCNVSKFVNITTTGNGVGTGGSQNTAIQKEIIIINIFLCNVGRYQLPSSGYASFYLTCKEKENEIQI